MIPTPFYVDFERPYTFRHSPHYELDLFDGLRRPLGKVEVLFAAEMVVFVVVPGPCRIEVKLPRYRTPDDPAAYWRQQADAIEAGVREQWPDALFPAEDLDSVNKTRHRILSLADSLEAMKVAFADRDFALVDYIARDIRREATRVAEGALETSIYLTEPGRQGRK